MHYRLADDEDAPDQITEALDWTVRSLKQTGLFQTINVLKRFS